LLADAMRLLVTRPEPDAAETARRLEALGHSVTVEPLLKIVLNRPPRDLPDPAGLIVTSRNGVRALLTWPQASGWRDVPLFAVGEATGSEARAAGFRRVTAGGGEGANLVPVIGAALAAASGPVIYAAARDLSGGLAEHLEEAGYDLQMVEAYRAERAESLSPEVLAALEAGAIDGALFYSRRTAETFRDLVAGHAIRLAHAFALAQPVAGPLKGLSGTLHVAEAPDEASLLALIPPQ
jgi:uroporphyrinogen-III synthase